MNSIENKDLCVRCNKPTDYHPNTPITVRQWYVEGAGQLCESCFHILYPVLGAFGNHDSSTLSSPSENKDIPNKL